MPASIRPPSIIEFGVFEVDLRSGELRKCGVKVRIQELPFQALKLLLNHPNEVLSREDFRHALWPDDIYVDFDRGVISAINRLRETLGDSAEQPIFIETVGRRGYRWIAPLHAEQENDSAAASEGEQTVEKLNLSATPRKWRYLFPIAILVMATLAVAWLRYERPQDPQRKQGQQRPRPSANREAEELYWRGRYYWEKRTPESLNKAVDAFTQAIVHDPGYAPAYVGLADCYNLLREYTVMPAAEAYPRAFAAAKKAVELDPQSSQAHASLAFVSFNGMWNVQDAEREFREAIRLDPNNAVAHHWYATYLECLRRYQESLTEIERAQALDPTSKAILADKAGIIFTAGDTRRAVAMLKQIEQDEPNFISPHRYLKFIYLITGDYPHYLAEAEQEARLMHDSAALETLVAIRTGLASGGGAGLLRALSLCQKQLYDSGRLSPYYLAVTYAIMDDKQQAMRFLQIAYDQHVDGVAQLEADHAFDGFTDQPAFRKLLHDIGLPPLQ